MDDKIGTNKSIHLQMRKLDHLFVLLTISPLKKDVEGCELFVVKGALKNLKICSSIYFEYSVINKYNYHPIEIINLLKSLHFSI
ncbi:FkbM family methyltransferase [Pedobacter sp. KLB.chiD]|uniref:FkbM family methyltransferase n=1 Tax=Pedobacter sp. KLB.chiD TaxID=3387402 RepID=UPI00399C02B0